MTPREANTDLLAEITALRDRVASLTRENADLQGELKQGSHREAATSEILRVISGSRNDLQPVMQTIVESAVRLADADNAMIGRAEDDHIHWLATAGTLSPRLQQPAKVWRIGSLPPSGNKGAGFAVFREGLRELGYVEGQNIAFEFRSSEGKAERLLGLVAELVRLKVDVILAGVRLAKGTAAAAGAVVTQHTDPYSLIAGVPARPIGRRVSQHGRGA